MKFATIAALLASVSFAHAQDAPKPPEEATGSSNQTQAPVTAPAPAPVKFYLEWDQDGINALNECVQFLPKRVADPLILRINGQLSVQAKIAADYTAAMGKSAADKIKGKK